MKILTITLSAMLYLFYHTKIDENRKNAVRFEGKLPILARRCVTLFRIYVTSSQQLIAIHAFNVNLAHFLLTKYFYMFVMPPTLKKLEGHIAFGLSVCLSVCGCVC